MTQSDEGAATASYSPATQWERAWTWYLIHKTISVSAVHSLSPFFQKHQPKLLNLVNKEQCNLQKETNEDKCLKGFAKAVGTLF